MREEGYYWVRFKEHPEWGWEPAEWLPNVPGWYKIGEEHTYDDDEFEVGSRLEPPS